MLRFGVRGRSVCLESFERCFEALGNVRESSGLATISALSSKRMKCLIDSEAGSRRAENRRLSSTSTPEARKTCLYDLHVENRGKHMFAYLTGCY